MMETKINYSRGKDSVWLEDLQERIKGSIKNNESEVLFILDHESLFNFDWDPVISYINSIDESIIAVGGTSSQECISINNSAELLPNIERSLAFVIKKELYELILSITQHQLNCISILDFFNLIMPTKISWKIEKRVCDKGNNEHRINVIIPFRNVGSYLEECLQSVICQEYSNYRVFVIDDCSEQSHREYIPQKDNIVFIENKKRKYALANIIDVLINQEFNNENDIILLLDGDDLLENRYVFHVINQYYSHNRSCRMTFGSFRILNSYSYYNIKYSKEEYINVRKSPWKGIHLRTFKVDLFREYLKLDPKLYYLKDEKGNFYNITSDMALLFPLMEICGYEQIFFIPNILYRYRLHEQNDHNIHRIEQKVAEENIRRKKPLLPNQILV